MTPTERKGMWFGLLGVTMFAVTLPVTRLAVGTPEDPHLSGVFLAMGRAVVAACLSVIYLWISKAAFPMEGPWLGGAGGGVWLSAVDLFGHALRRSHTRQRHHRRAATCNRKFGGSYEQTKTVLGVLAVRCHRHCAGGGLCAAALRTVGLAFSFRRFVAIGCHGLCRAGLRLGWTHVANHGCRASDLLGFGDIPAVDATDGMA